MVDKAFSVLTKTEISMRIVNFKEGIETSVRSKNEK